MVKLNPVNCELARTALRLTVKELGKAAGVSHMSVARFERGENVRETTVDAIESALLSARLTVDGTAWRVQLLNGKSLGGAKLVRCEGAA